MVYKWLNTVLWALYPPVCVVCEQALPASAVAGDLCDPCRDALPWRRGPVCGQCGLALEGHEALRCGACLARPPAFDRLFVPLAYESPVGALITDFKFHGRLAPGRVLAGLLTDAVTAAVADAGLPLPEALVPVPLHPARLARRGFNQAVELARPLAGALDLPLHTAGIRRQQDTPAQSTLTAKARRSNLRQAFAVSGPVPARVAIVDDVVTTGATVEALARVLQRAGAEQVQVWALARA